MNSRTTWFAAAAVAALAAGPAAAVHQWGSYHWTKSSSDPVRLDVLRQLGSQWNTAYAAAIVDWDAPKTSVLELTAAPSNAGVSPKKCNAISGKVLVCSDSYGFRGWLGVASIWANGDHIYQATTKVNDSYFNTASYNKSEWRALVMCQEVGHDFGLDHQDENFDNPNLGTCMDYTNEPLGGGAYGTLNNEHPNTHDYGMLETMYDHTDTGGGGGGGRPGGGRPANGSDAFSFREVGNAPASAAPGSGSDSAGDSPAEWGLAIRFDAHGRPNVYRMDLGGGRAKVTHVFWAPGFRPQGSR